MPEFPEKLRNKLRLRQEAGNLRSLPGESGLVDFASNDYLGFARKYPAANGPPLAGGSTGSRLISGNHSLYRAAEKRIAEFHRAEAALIYNSGYDANLGLLSALPQRTDIVFYDAAVHASIRDGLRLSPARSFAFPHLDLAGLEKKARTVFRQGRPKGAEVYVVTESVFSMEGDGPDLEPLLEYCAREGFRLILDEAHAVGVLGPEGRGLAAGTPKGTDIFARVITLGKALGAHGAAVLGGAVLKQYQVNFSRSLIYTTALPPASLGHALEAYARLEGPEGTLERQRLEEAIRVFEGHIRKLGIDGYFTGARAAIRHLRVGDSRKAAEYSALLASAGFDVRAIRPPTVPPGEACLRICLHSFNRKEEIQEVLTILGGTLRQGKHEQ